MRVARGEARESRGSREVGFHLEGSGDEGALLAGGGGRRGGRVGQDRG